MFSESKPLLQNIEELEKGAKENREYNDNPFFCDSIIIGANLGDDNDSYICNSVNIRSERDINKNALIISRSKNTFVNECHIFPYNTGEVCPGFCIVPSSKNTIVITEQLSGCAIYIYRICNYNIYVHFEKNGSLFQFENSICKSELIKKINNTSLIHVDEKVIANPLFKIEKKDYYQLHMIKNRIKSEYGIDKLDKFAYYYSPVIHQINGSFNCFFFPTTINKGKIKAMPEGNFLYRLPEKEYIFAMCDEVNCCNIF